MTSKRLTNEMRNEIISAMRHQLLTNKVKPFERQLYQLSHEIRKDIFGKNLEIVESLPREYVQINNFFYVEINGSEVRMKLDYYYPL